jgi:type II secretory pathway pseudopilin PulG
MTLNTRAKSGCQTGLTLVEGTVVLAILAVAAGLYLSTLSRGYQRSSRVGCVNNLKQVVLGFRLWANDHGDDFPFASMAPDSSRPFANIPQVFRHFQVASNEMVKPKILRCHTDQTRTAATGFQQLLNTNLSYFVGLDAREDAPNSILSGDRNITGGTWTGGFLRTLTPRTEAGWTEELHQYNGNVGLADGSVQQFSTNGLRQHLAGMTNVAIRLAVP